MSSDDSWQQNPVDSWTVGQVGQWLQFLDLGQYRKKFTSNSISGAELVELDQEDLVQLGITTLGHRKRILTEIKNLQANKEALIDNSDSWSEGSDSNTSASGAASSSSSSSKEPEATYVVVKVYYKKKIAALSVKPDCTIEKLKKMVQMEFNRKLQLSYEDSDGDRIPLKKDKDLRTALRTVKPPIRVTASSRRRGTRASSLAPAEGDILEGLVDAVIVIDVYGNILLFNRSAEQLLGYSKGDAVGENVKMLMPAVYASKHDEYLSNYVRTGISNVIGKGRTVMAQHSSGRMMTVALSVTETKDRKKHIFIGTLRPVQDSGLGEFSEYADIKEPVIAIDSVGTVLYANKGTESLVGFTVEEVVGQNVNMLMPSPYKENHLHYMLNYQRSGISKVIGKKREVITETKDGSIIPVFLSVNERTRANGEKYFIGMITQRTQLASAKPKTFIQQQRQVVHELQTPAIIIDERGTMQAFNDAASRMLGYDLSETLGQNVNKLMGAPHAARHDQYLRNYLETGVAKVIGKERVLQAKTATGELLTIKLTVTEAKQADKRLFIGMLHVA